jgi:hypothetical protein
MTGAIIADHPADKLSDVTGDAYSGRYAGSFRRSEWVIPRQPPWCASALEHTERKSDTYDVNLCARGDLNPYVRGHQNLNLARLPISPLARDGTTVQRLPGSSAIAKLPPGVAYSSVTPPGIITIK